MYKKIETFIQKNHIYAHGHEQHYLNLSPWSINRFIISAVFNH